jgi:hypothetical protein
MTVPIRVLANGLVAGLVAGIPQVLITQAEARLLAIPNSRADIGPRFVQRLGQHAEAEPSVPVRWMLAGGFHFGYAAAWGLVYAALQRWRPAQPHVGGPLLAALIYALAFSPWGAATRTGTERDVVTRPIAETLLHWTAALGFSLPLAVLFARLENWPRPEHGIAARARG